ncbi:MAG: carnitine dehydratase [Gammaproteobacteria bacterium]|nr:carnitine dehydratase [Gammaproteobacteria bacterium]
MKARPTGPLVGLRVLEFAGVGPVQFTGMMLADMGAEITRIDRLEGGDTLGLPYDILDRGRRSVALDLRRPGCVDAVLRLVERSDALIEGYRPGVMERLGLGPDLALARNPKLVYGRVTGWGQSGPLARTAGHDINYIAVSGALHAIGTDKSGPIIPLNLVGDFGGGGMLLTVGLLAALHESQRSGRGQVVDAAMTDGTALLLGMIHSLRAAGQWSAARQANLLDGGAPFYGTYCCADDRWIAVGPLEPKFYAAFLRALGLDEPVFREQHNRAMWPRLKEALTVTFRGRTRQQWCELLTPADACVAPVLDLDEAPGHAHNAERGTYSRVDGVTQPAPAPRFSRTPGNIQGSPPVRGADTRKVLGELGLTESALALLLGSDSSSTT